MLKCEICGYEGEVLERHIKDKHGQTVQEYAESHQGAEVLSDKAKSLLAARKVRKESGFFAFNISTLFGVEFEAKNEIEGFLNPQDTTPDIDPAYVFQKDGLLACLAGVELPNERVFLTGHTGSGKSSIVQQVAARLNLGFCRINCDNDITRADFIGQYTLKGETMEFVYGLLPRAMMEGQVLLLDEIDAANPGVVLVLQSVLEKNGKLTIPETGETITPHKNFRIFATGNTRGQGDDTGMYAGTQPQNGAMIDRFTWVEVINYPDKKTEKRIVVSVSGISKEIAKKIVEVATLIREAYENGDISVTMSTRTSINIAEKIKMLGDVEKAYRVAFLNKCNPEDETFAKEAIQRVFG